LTWQASTSANVAGYNIYRNGDLLSFVDSATEYQDSSVPSGIAVAYSVTTVVVGGYESSPVSVTVASL